MRQFLAYGGLEEASGEDKVKRVPKKQGLKEAGYKVRPRSKPSCVSILEI